MGNLSAKLCFPAGFTVKTKKNQYEVINQEQNEVINQEQNEVINQEQNEVINQEQNCR
jgi:hypothetical protein